MKRAIAAVPKGGAAPDRMGEVAPQLRRGRRRLGIVTFSWEGDAPLVPLCLESVRRLPRPEDLDVIHFVVDDGLHPMPPADYGDAVYLATDYDRGGNQVGTENLMGQTALYAELIRKWGLDLVYKLDPDTVACGLGIADLPREYGLVGASRNPKSPWPWGTAALYRAEVLAEVGAAIGGRAVKRAMERVPERARAEDMITGTIAVRALGYKVDIRPIDGPGGLQVFSEDSMEPDVRAFAITCKGRRPGPEPEPARDVVARMRRAIDAVNSRR